MNRDREALEAATGPRNEEEEEKVAGIREGEGRESLKGMCRYKLAAEDRKGRRLLVNEKLE